MMQHIESIEEYGLFSSQRNRFIVVSANYRTLKFAQLLIMKHELLYLLDFTGIYGYRKGVVNNDRCMKISIANGEKMRIEIDVNFTNPGYKLVPAPEEKHDDQIFREKVIFLCDLIDFVDDNNKKLIANGIKQVEILKRGLDGFKDFLSMVLPEDKKVQHLIDREIANKDVPAEILSEFQSILFRILYSIDWGESLDDIKIEIAKKLDEVPLRAYFFLTAINAIKEWME